PVHVPLDREVDRGRVLEVELHVQSPIRLLLGLDVEQLELRRELAVADVLLLLARLVSDVGVRRSPEGRSGASAEQHGERGGRGPGVCCLYGVGGPLGGGGGASVSPGGTTGLPPITCTYRCVSRERAKTSIVSPGSSAKLPSSTDSP